MNRECLYLPMLIVSSILTDATAHEPASVADHGVPLFVSDSDQRATSQGRRGAWKATGADTGGSFAFVEGTAEPGKGPVPHRHSREDEAWYNPGG